MEVTRESKGKAETSEEGGESVSKGMKTFKKLSWKRQLHLSEGVGQVAASGKGSES